MAVTAAELGKIVKGIINIINPFPLEPGRYYGGGAQQLEKLLGYNSSHSLLRNGNNEDPIVTSEKDLGIELPKEGVIFTDPKA